MPVRVALAVIPFLLASASALQAQDATTTSPNAAAPTSMPANPVQPTESSSASAGAKNVVCEVSDNHGDVVPLRQCVSKDEANRRRLQQQEAIRQFQLQSMTMQPH